MDDKFKNIASEQPCSGSGPEFVYPLNPTDPFVKHDPRNLIQETVGVYNDNDIDAMGPVDDTQRPTNQDVQFTAGKFTPIISVCNRALPWNNIYDMTIDYKGFIPTIELTTHNVGFSSNVASTGDTITVVFVPTIEKTFRTISLTFLIKEIVDRGNEYMSYYGEYKCVPLIQSKTKIIVSDDCPIICQIKKSKVPNTFELLHTIALETGLGFAATDETKVEDRMTRIVAGDTYKDYIMNIIQYSGVDSKTILDCWIDLYGYLTLVNLPFIFDADVDYKRYSMISSVGSYFTNKNMPAQKDVLINRVISNFNVNSANSNIAIYDDYCWENNNKMVFNNGNLKTIMVMTGKENGGVDSMTAYDIETTQKNARAQVTEEYYTRPKPEIVINTGEYYNIPLQKNIRDSYLAEKRSIRLKVHLRQLNFALQRGTLVHVSLYESNPAKKALMVYNIKNALKQYGMMFSDAVNDIGYKATFDNELERITNEEAKNLILDDDITPTHLDDFESMGTTVTERDMLSSYMQMPNWYSSGLYYIDGMEIKFDNESEEIQQYLYLIKKDWLLKINDKYMPLHFDPNIY